MQKDTAASLEAIRSQAKELIDATLSALTSPIQLPRSIMGQSEVQFASIIQAAYFRGRIPEGPEIGLRKPAIGRQLDLIRSVAESTVQTGRPPELVVRLMAELLAAPWFYETRARTGGVASQGIFQYLRERHRSGYYRPIYMAIREEAESLMSFARTHETWVKEYYGDPERYDLIYSTLIDDGVEPQLGGVLPVDALVTTFINAFHIRPTPAVAIVIHEETGKEVVNTIKTEGYENDAAKRLIEIGALKRMLIPARGVPVIALLVAVKSDKQGHTEFRRIPCQGLRLNRNVSNFTPIIIGEN